MKTYDPKNWYWYVGTDTTRVWSSVSRTYVLTDDPTFVSWLNDTNLPSRIDSEDSLWRLLVDQAPAIAMQVPAALEFLKDSELGKFSDGSISLIAKVLLNHENRIRTLENRVTITMAQFKTGVRALL